MEGKQCIVVRPSKCVVVRTTNKVVERSIVRGAGVAEGVRAVLVGKHHALLVQRECVVPLGGFVRRPKARPQPRAYPSPLRAPAPPSLCE